MSAPSKSAAGFADTENEAISLKVSQGDGVRRGEPFPRDSSLALGFWGLFSPLFTGEAREVTEKGRWAFSCRTCPQGHKVSRRVSPWWEGMLYREVGKYQSCIVSKSAATNML